ncbi:hypothetical protein B0T22DRAFT_481714 [Podospora appendiculata]|uniref:Zn(2)-C6 fungal-type domain-containing protein n=1 Tax=Podospora appendiculata TaxID=314037 RepID=A0AAE1CEH1_9PEZI|nr:hypothetical protein B0T22DRAFT_481714 [Podospora appendiculata]
MPRLRLGHTKSRGGCLRCKQRRVKCDENRPCGACLRHGIECSLVTDTPGPGPNEQYAPQTPLPSTTATPSQPSLSPLPLSPDPNISTLTLSDSPGALPSDPFPYFAKYILPQPPHTTLTASIPDLELLHHYTTSTYLTLAPSATSGHKLWQITIPQLSFSHVFLLHQILAISAFHLAYLVPSKRQQYSLCASHHQSIAIQGVRAALASISADNCHAIFPTSSLLFVGALAASMTCPDEVDSPKQTPTFDDLIDTFLLVKGIRSVLNSSVATLASGPLAGFFQPPPAHTSDTPQPHSPILGRLAAQMQSLAAKLPLPSPSPLTQEQIGIIQAEIAHFIETTAFAAAAVPESPQNQVMVSWPIFMTDGFLEMVRERNEAAMAVMAYYCVVMHAAAEDYWFVGGWAESVVREIEAGMDEEGRWREDSAWALGWVRGLVVLG